jgi:hypothetical protein
MSAVSRFQVSAQPLAKKNGRSNRKKTLVLRSLSKGECGSLSNRGPAIEAADLIKVETFTCGASYKESEIQAQKPSVQKWFAFDCGFSDA